MAGRQVEVVHQIAIRNRYSQKCGLAD
jgi:hypothetical protein